KVDEFKVEHAEDDCSPSYDTEANCALITGYAMQLLMNIWLPNQNINALTLRSLIEKEKLNRSNFLDWHRNLRITLKYKEKLHHIDSPLLDSPAENANPEQVVAYQALLAEKDKVVLLMLACMTHEHQKEMKNFNAYDMINELKTCFKLKLAKNRMILKGS
ncbi:hypothetical protein Tco_0840415, partial [Tanacetum coccineum]